MRVVKTMRDIEVLKSSGALPGAYLCHIEGYFRDLAECLGGEGQDVGTFDLEEHGYLVLLEPGDDLRGGLVSVGMHPEHEGLLGAPLEFSERIDLEGMSVYRIGVMYDNDYVMVFYAPAGGWPVDISEWLEESLAG